MNRRGTEPYARWCGRTGARVLLLPDVSAAACRGLALTAKHPTSPPQFTGEMENASAVTLNPAQEHPEVKLESEKPIGGEACRQHDRVDVAVLGPGRCVSMLGVTPEGFDVIADCHEIQQGLEQRPGLGA